MSDKAKLNLECELDLPIVCHVVTSLGFGGVERHMEVLASALGEARMQHIFVAIGKGGAAENKLTSLGANVVCLNRNPLIPSMSAIFCLLKLFFDLKPLVVHTHGAEANFHGLIAARFANIPVRVAEEIGIPSHSRHAKYVFRKIYKLSHKVIGVSSVVAEWLSDSNEAPLNKIVAIDNPVLLPAIRSGKRVDSGVFRVVFVGRLEEVKNPIGLLRAFAILQDTCKKSELWYVGDGKQLSLLKTLTNDLELDTKVRFLGYQKDPFKYIYQADVLVQPSISEGFGLGLVEAMGCGVPVVSTVVGGAPDIIVEGETGWLLADSTPESIAAGMLIAGKMGAEKLNEMGLRARESVAGRYKPSDYVKTLESLYRGISSFTGVRT